jgi:hypothetical protein
MSWHAVEFIARKHNLNKFDLGGYAYVFATKYKIESQHGYLEVEDAHVDDLVKDFKEFDKKHREWEKNHPL